MKTCPYCATRIDPQALKCSSCRTDLYNPAIIKAITGYIACPFCGNIVSKEVHACPFCQEDIDQFIVMTIQADGMDPLEYEPLLLENKKTYRHKRRLANFGFAMALVLMTTLISYPLLAYLGRKLGLPLPFFPFFPFFWGVLALAWLYQVLQYLRHRMKIPPYYKKILPFHLSLPSILLFGVITIPAYIRWINRNSASTTGSTRVMIGSLTFIALALLLALALSDPQVPYLHKLLRLRQ